MTPGPWHIEEEDQATVRAFEGWIICTTSSDADSEHIARCSPDNIRALIDALREKDMTIAALQANLAEALDLLPMGEGLDD